MASMPWSSVDRSLSQAEHAFSRSNYVEIPTTGSIFSINKKGFCHCEILFANRFPAFTKDQNSKLAVNIQPKSHR